MGSTCTWFRVTNGVCMCYRGSTIKDSLSRNLGRTFLPSKLSDQELRKERLFNFCLFLDTVLLFQLSACVCWHMYIGLVFYMILYRYCTYIVNRSLICLKLQCSRISLYIPNKANINVFVYLVQRGLHLMLQLGQLGLCFGLGSWLAGNFQSKYIHVELSKTLEAD